MIRKHKTLALAALLSVSVICALGAGRTADQKSPDTDKADQAVADEFIGVWHTTSATTSFLIEIKPDGEAFFVLIQGGTHGIDNVSWKPLPGGLLVNGIPRLRFWKGRNKNEARVEMESLPPGMASAEITEISAEVYNVASGRETATPQRFPAKRITRRLGRCDAPRRFG